MDDDFYRFDPVCDREGRPTKWHKRFVDEKDFQINPLLLKQINFDSCRETTPEGKALWLYIRLCQLLKYDEGYFYNDNRHHPNDDPYESFNIVDKVTADTPTTCFNFSRIAVKLLNQIPGVEALMIAVGGNSGHFRFGYYTDKVSVDCEPTSPNQHFNDLARARLGIRPQGLKVFHGQQLMYDLMQKLSDTMLTTTRRGLRDYLGCLQQLQVTPQEPEIAIEPLVSILKKYNVDGASTVQLLKSLNHQFAVQPYRLLRAGLVTGVNQVEPQLLVREDQTLRRIALDEMRVYNLSVRQYRDAVMYGDMVYSQDDYEKALEFGAGLQDEPKEQVVKKVLISGRENV